MGDADAEVVIQIPAREIEAWMDEALGVVDEGFDNLLALVMNLQERTKGILRELKIMESFRKIFISLNVFIVPVAIAIMVCYGTNKSVQVNSSALEIAFQTLVLFLMFLASAVGLPMYLVSVWESYKAFEIMSEDHSLSNESESPPSLLEDSLLTQLSPQSSLERLSEFVRLLNDRMPRRMREDLQRRMSAENSPAEQTPEMQDSSEIEMESAATETTASLETVEEKRQDQYHSEDEKPKAAEFPILYKFHVLMNEQSPDLAVRLEATKRAKSKETTESEEEMAKRNERQPARETQVVAPSTAGNDE